ncbi:acyltransferase family protein [Tetragenococcus halophilus]|uniref:acyltransferase family protein n=1 Tax=Tetragenococcus halophilus TaxID=51669 RepID=UPI001F26A4D8|nr:acyltransferase family protein [Tetragenococcus halophilus]MCF1602843.1 acetyltransferase [Tetragenococcus halophilus]MCO8288881.1 acetyltransferase [Tetragenococcus halophilus]MCO8290565.1 acetyltransferase [Tetragenococcus halophilus]MCT8310958.1 acetyltransferase [Tetragenococcus halophilus]MDN6722949.1 acetyltransferase [Tetragenococcus halophilus]
MEKKRIKNSRYITGIDGIRTLAVIGVILYHLLPSYLPGGYLGVPILLVISGYLITDLLRQEWKQNEKIDVLKFYIRRLKRLYPSLVTVLVVSTAYITLFQRNLLNNIRGAVFSSLLYVNNWWQIDHGLSYFDRFGNESPFTHLWTMAVEGQNYLIWPLLFILLIKFVRRRDWIFYILTIGGLLSAIGMAVGFTPGEDPTRIYYGTDTRIFSILIGNALAFIWPSTRLKEEIPDSAKKILNTAGLASLFLLIVSYIFMDDRFSFPYYGGIYFVSVVTAVLVAVTAHPGASLNRWLTNPVFSYLGKRSYGIYLYQFPVMIFYEAKVNVANNVWLHVFIELALIVLCSELSYRFIEEPLRKFDYKKTWTMIKGWFSKPILSKQKAVGIASFIVVLIASIGVSIAPSSAVNANQAEFQEEIQENKQAAQKTKNEDDTDDSEEETQDTATDENILETYSTNTDHVMEKYGLTEKQVKQAKETEVTAFGDSVLLGSTKNIQEIFPDAVIDADVGRQLYDSVDLLQELKDEDNLKENVVLALGSNGYADEAQFDDLMDVIGDRKVYLINVRVPTQRWQNDNNSLFKKMNDKYKRITLVDWYDLSNENTNWFREDQVHPTDVGRVEYTSLLAKKILE